MKKCKRCGSAQDCREVFVKKAPPCVLCGYCREHLHAHGRLEIAFVGWDKGSAVFKFVELNSQLGGLS